MNSFSTCESFHTPLTPVWDIGPKYTFLRSIGVGSYGFVCEAVENATQRHVAIKKYTDILNDAILCRRVLREIEILFSLDHPFIVKPLDLLIRNDISDIYLVMELSQSDLGKVIKSPIYLEKRQVKLLMYRLLLGLDYLHSYGIVHRDIKPGNILINRDCIIRICDFSLSRTIGGLNTNQFDSDLAMKKNPLLKKSSESYSSKSLINF